MAKILVVGCGAIGGKLAVKLTQQGHQVVGLKRTPPVHADESIRRLAADISRADDLRGLDADFDYLFFIVAPSQRTEAHYRAVYENGIAYLLDRFEGSLKPHWFFISSTSVYAQNQGEWIDEASPAEPNDACSRLIRQAELTLGNAGVPHTVVRFSGIYGPGRESLLRKAKTSPVIQQNPPYYTNRIHEADCLGVLLFLLETHLAGQPLAKCYLASDDDPATLWSVMSWLAAQLACPPPVAQLNTGAVMNKRCSNTALKKLGYRFRYAGYQEGYADLIRGD